MWREWKLHWKPYLVLILGLLVFVYVYLESWPNDWMVRYISLALGIFYTIWGIVTHTKTKTVTQQVVMEYSFVALLAVALLWFITF